MNLLTKRLPTLLGILMLLGIVGGLAWWITSNRPIVSEEITPTKVRVSNVADNKFVVSWITTVSTTGMVEYGMVGEDLKKQALDERDVDGSQSSLTHHVIVEGLQPDSEYLFRIISGESRAKFDNNGSPYSVKTGKIVGSTPIAKSLYGQVVGSNNQPAEGTIVYLLIPGGGVASTLVKSSGSYVIPISTIRTESGREYLKYDPNTTVATLSLEDGVKTASAMVSMSAVAPVPSIAMGETLDFRASSPVEAEVAEVKPVAPTIFNVEPLGDVAGGSEEIKILNPGVEGEEIATTLPEFRGVAPIGATLTITVHSTIPYSDTIVSGLDGTWEWTPPEELGAGEHTVMIAYIDEAGIEQTVTKSFFVATAYAAEGDPAYEATPSSQVYASPTPVASVRTTIPSTESGVPVTGITEFTWLTGAVGIVIMVLGAITLAI